ncbi:hypothetical protein SAMN04488028_102183 [Reichenbachiella agariperforans]|uniref:Uncharacterized protein n=1 Tax=Reichenbachiella agariperforans TaxID=156994 RepID=A0A1M6NB76_REIAG|nr:hypothetical protein SAMN04488028_102183 [Reichenbachiella agariperforans]
MILKLEIGELYYLIGERKNKPSKLKSGYGIDLGHILPPYTKPYKTLHIPFLKPVIRHETNLNHYENDRTATVGLRFKKGKA